MRGVANQGWPEPTVSSRVRVLRSAVGWAHAERIVDIHPLNGMSGPPCPGVRMHAPVDDVRAILECARSQLGALESATPACPAHVLHRAEQMQLLARLVADSGARCGELAALPGRRSRRRRVDDKVLVYFRAPPVLSPTVMLHCSITVELRYWNCEWIPWLCRCAVAGCHHVAHRTAAAAAP
jgi:hypothetical protein